MKLSNFQLLETKGAPLCREFLAEVDVTTGFWFWQKTQRVKIFREFAGSWYFVDSGKFTPEFQAEELARAWKAKTGQEA